MSLILLSLIVLGAIGAIASFVLFFVSKKFRVEEDPRISQIINVLPGANCGGCGFPGCSGFADALVKSDTIDSMNCPVGGSEIMNNVAEILGKSIEVGSPKIAVVRCNGTCENRPRINQYDGAKTCTIASNLYSGETACSYGCLSYGDCVKACPFDAIRINKATNLPEVDEEKCVACGKCVDACPKLLIELRKKGPKSKRVYVACRNKDKPAVAMKSCKVSCISCKKCVKVCAFDAITIENNLAFVDDNKCRLCRKCVSECPNSAIIEINFPQKKHVENV
ncbi:Fe-S cluster domain-containing protein [Bacteroidales bacterium OttesenSCG-928-M11]|nr:Fe-S cluster domain-containing protein [Bacteroidales bacterium OttesenSCG-928-M11]